MALSPSEMLNDYLGGKNPEPCEAVYSCASFFIYKKARAILKLPKQQRLNVIEQAPDYLQERLKNEITRLWRINK